MIIILTLTVLASSMLMPYLNYLAEASGINTLLTVPGQTVKLVYEYDFSLSVRGTSNNPVKMLVIQHYIINIVNYNRTHIEVSGRPVGNISVVFTSNSWISIYALMRVISGNLTELIEGLSLMTIHPSLIEKKDFSYVIAKVMYVSPIVTLSKSAGCVNLTLNGVRFRAAEITSGINGVAYYECRTGILLRYLSKSAKALARRNVSLNVIKSLNVSLVGGDKETLKLLSASVPQQKNPAKVWFGLSPTLLGVLIASIAAFTASLAFFIKYRITGRRKS